jgi:hypothetical protein
MGFSPNRAAVFKCLNGLLTESEVNARTFRAEDWGGSGVIIEKSSGEKFNDVRRRGASFS